MAMKIYLLFGLIFLQFCISLFSQDISGHTYLEIRQDAMDKFGPMMDLINGEMYNFPYRAAKGDPFLNSNSSYHAVIRIGETEYENQRLRFDIYNQQVILDFNDRFGSTGSIVLHNEWLDQFVLNGMLFKKYSEAFGSDHFLQVIYDGFAACLYLWEKTYKPDLRDGERGYKFSAPIRKSFILVNDNCYSYEGRRSFLRCFSPVERPMIKSYIKENRIRMRRAPDQEIRLLMEFIENSIKGIE
jgi:hypothetical protein